jgi:hypothetical protein
MVRVLVLAQVFCTRLASLLTIKLLYWRKFCVWACGRLTCATLFPILAALQQISDWYIFYTYGRSCEDENFVQWGLVCFSCLCFCVR